MNANITKLTKAELLTLIAQRDTEVSALRLRVSTLEGAAALRAAPVVRTSGGQRPVVERHGQRVVKRWSAA